MTDDTDEDEFGSGLEGVGDPGTETVDEDTPSYHSGRVRIIGAEPAGDSVRQQVVQAVKLTGPPDEHRLACDLARSETIRFIPPELTRPAAAPGPAAAFRPVGQAIGPHRIRPGRALRTGAGIKVGDVGQGDGHWFLRCSCRHW